MHAKNIFRRKRLERGPSRGGVAPAFAAFADEPLQPLKISLGWNSSRDELSVILEGATTGFVAGLIGRIHRNSAPPYFSLDRADLERERAEAPSSAPQSVPAPAPATG